MANILLIVGSTGGHIYPALSIAQLNSNHNYYIFAPKEAQNKVNLGIDPTFFKKELNLKSIFFPLNIIHDISQLINFVSYKKIELVICFGSIYSLTAIGSKILGKPLILMEQNVLPGRAIRLLSNIADLIFVPFKESLDYISRKSKCVVMLSPVRKEFFTERSNLNEETMESILFMGGSLGARSINKLALEFIKNDFGKNKNLSFKKVVVITGKRLYLEFLEEVKKIEREIDLSNIEIIEYCQDVEKLYFTSKVVVSRAGGSTIAEVLALKKRALVIPFPYALDNHQYYNALIAKKYTNFVDFLLEPISYDSFIQKLELLQNVEPIYMEKINFFDHSVFFESIGRLIKG